MNVPTRADRGATRRDSRAARGDVLTILIADDHPLILAGLRDSLEGDGGFELVAEAHSGPEVLPLVKRTKPDVVLLDLRMPGIDGLGCLDRIAARHPDTKVVIVSASADPERIQAAFDHGAAGYIVKGVGILDLAKAIRSAVEGSGCRAHGVPDAQAAGLTERELTIVTAVARGLSNEEIGAALWVTERTIKFHLTNIYRKLGVRNRTGAAHWTFSQGLLDASEANLAAAARRM